MTQQTIKFLRFLQGRRTTYAWAITLIAGLTYITGAAPDIFPGDSASLVAQHAGIDPFAPLSHILWGWIGNIFALIPLGALGFRWNLFSAVSGAASCGLITLLAIRMVEAGSNPVTMARHPLELRNLAGLTAGLLLVFCMPFRIASTIAHPATFELLLLLASIWLFVRFLDSKKLHDGVVASAFIGLTASQNTSALMLLPAYTCLLAYVLWRRNVFRAGPVIATIGAMTAAFALIPVITTWRFSQSPSFAWSDMKGVGDILLYMAKDIYIDLRYSTPKVAITIVGLFSLVPFFAVVLLQRNRGIGSQILMGLCMVIGILLFFNVRFAPWPMFGFRPLLIMPYAIAAMWVSYLIATSISALQTSWFIQMRVRRNPRTMEVASGISLAAVALFVTGAMVVSHRAIDTTSALFVTNHADALVKQTDNDMWLIIDTQMEPLVRIKARENDKHPLILSAQRFNHKPYQNAVAAQLGDARLGSMVEMGLIPLLRERLEPAHEPAPVIAVAGDPGILRFIAGEAVPDRTLYMLPGRDAPAPNWMDYMDGQRAWWKYSSTHVDHSAFSEIGRRLKRQSARIANDTGAWLEEQGQPEYAREAYRAAIQINPENLSAHLNLRALMTDEDPEATGIEETIESLSAVIRGKATLLQIMDVDGQIRHHVAKSAAEQRWDQADHVAELDPRIEPLLSIENDAEALRRILAFDDKSDSLRLGLARIAAGKKRLDLARDILNAIPASGPIGRVILVEKANIDIQQGRPEEAYRALSSIPESEITDPRPLILLASITVESHPQDCDRYLAQLENFPNLLISLELPIARIYMSRQNPAMAIRHLSNLVVHQPLNREALQMLVRLYLDQGDVAAAIRPAKQLLSISSRDPVANAALALHLDKKGQTIAAKEARDIALSGNPVLSVYF